MSQSASRPRTVFRACVVNAVRGGEVLMGKLVKVTQGALAEEESSSRNIQQRNLISDSLRLLNQHEPALVKGYSMALLEIFAEGPAISKGRATEDTGMDFGELSLLDESEMLAQVELSKAQQSALHATDAVLAELNTLVSSAQGLRSVQPERNPLRPESYIRALQQVVGETGVSSEIRQLWMQHMRDLLGKLLVDEYKSTAKSLRDHGVQPVGYAVVGAPGGPGGRGAPGTGYGGTGYGTGYGPGTGYGSSYDGYGHSMNAPMGDYGPAGYGRGMGPATGWSGESQQGAMAPDAEEALLTVGILRQMLAGGDPFEPRLYGGAPMQQVMLQPGAGPAGWIDPSAGAMSAPSSRRGEQFPSGAAAEAMEDIAQLERLVGRLANPGGASRPGSLPAPLPNARVSGVAPLIYASMPMAAAARSPALANEVVRRMMENISNDARLLGPIQRAVKSLEPSLKQLVKHDGRFFTDDNHPARRLLDELTQRSLAYTTEAEPGFSRFMKLVREAVDHLSAHDIKDSGPFDTVLKALQSAWDNQEKKIQAQKDAEHNAQLHAEQREMLAEKMAADIRKLPDLERVPADILDFAAGPWADVVALAQVMNSGDGAEDDPGGYLALVPVLLWTAQPDLTRQEPERLNEAIPGLLAKLRKGLKTINHPAVQTSAFLQRLVGLHQAAFETPSSKSPITSQADLQNEGPTSAELSVSSFAPPDSEQAAVEAPDPYADFKIGVWVELVTNGRVVRTQLTWTSPHGTLFLFTAQDASTQSMTRRMRDKLASEGLLRLAPAPVITTRSADLGASEIARTRFGGTKSSSAPLSATPKATKNR